MDAKEYRVYRIYFLVLAVAMLVIEALPFSVRLYFSNGTEQFLEEYSYFNVRLFGFAVFFTFPIAILTCGMVATGILSLFLRKDALRVLVCVLSLLNAIASVLSLVFSYAAVSATGISVSMVAVGTFIMSLLCAGEVRDDGPRAGEPPRA